ncbi:MAG TPA: hypothetical protein VMS21_03790, partial [Methylomirabilota bacterium]|nr:hypothetical protein [Methylomirabilota bacterium]
WPVSPGTPREASGVPCLNPRRGLTLLSQVCRDLAIYLNLNYMLVAPTTEEPAVSGPFVENFSPERDSTNARRDGIAATITNRETELNAGSIELLVDGVQVTTGLTVSPTATGADISYVVSPPFGQASAHTVQLRYSDTQGNMFFNSWSFTTSPDALPIFTAPRLENGGLKLLVAFAEPPDPATAGEVNNYSSSGGVAFDAVELLGPRAVELSGTPVADGQAHLLTVRNLQDTLGNNVPEATISYNISPFLQDSAQRVAFEAESFHTNSAGTGQTYDGHMWGFSVDIPGYSGGGYMHNPLAFPLVEVSDVDSAARMDYRVRFTHPGTYRLWIRATESPGTKDSCHYGIDGVHVAAVGGIAVGVFNWSAQPEDAATLGANRFDIPAAGDYTVNIWVREDNLPLDKILIVPESDSINPSFENGGLGPDQSPRVGDIAVPDQPVLQYSRSSASELTFDWTGAGFHLEQTTDLVNPAWTDVPTGDTPPIAVPLSGEGMFFRLSD